MSALGLPSVMESGSALTLRLASGSASVWRSASVKALA
jgi:hypothetical protein